MRPSTRLTLRRLTLLACLLLCCTLAADDSAPAYAGPLGQCGAYPGGSHGDPVAGFTRGLSVGAFAAPSFLRAGSPLLAAMPGGTPYTGTALPVPGTIQAEDFDNGGEGVAYQDTTAANDGGFYRSSGVDVTSTYAGPNVGWTQVGEWLEYTVNVAATGTYKIEVIAATPYSAGNIHVRIDGVNVTGNMPIPNTGSWSAYGAASKSGVPLTTGTHVMRVGIDGYGFLFDRIQITSEQTPYGGTAWPIPGTIQAEDFDNGGEGVAYHDTNAANEGGFYRTTGVDVTSTYAGPNVGWTQVGEWLEYTVNVAAAGSYTVEAYAASPGATGAFHFEVDGVDVTGPMPVPNTGSWSNYHAVTKAGVNLTAGQHVLKVSIDGYGFLFDRIRVVPPAPAAPSGLAATAASTTQINLVWTDNSSNETGFKIERKTGAAGTYAEVATVAAGVTSYGNTGLASNTQYFYRVRATNAGGDSAYSNEASATTANQPPAVSLTAPATGSSYTAPATVTLTATASDPDGGVAKVEFYQGATKLGEDTSAPYNLTWANVAPGGYSLTAKAIDNAGASATSAAVSVTVSLPTVTVTATDGAASEQGSDTGTLTVTRTGGTASALTVNYTLSGTAVNGTDYGTLSGTVVIPAGSQSQAVTVTPLDDAVVETNGETVVLTLSANAAYQVGTPSAATVAIADNDTYPPTATINSPAGGAVFTVPATIEIVATASDADGTVSKVEFFRGTTKLGEDTTAPYSYIWVDPAAGGYSLTAKATDNAGATGTSAAVTVVVNTPPAVSLTSPASGLAFDDGSNITFNASATDADGSVSKVEFYLGPTKLGEDTSSPYGITWQNATEGSHTLTAVATDDRGATTTGSPVTVSVVNFAAARLDPANRTGAGGVDLVSRNFNWSLPLVSLPGRAGLDLGLSLSYNSLVWTKSGGYILFDADGGSPAPGFRLGFAVVQGKFNDSQAQKAAYILITPSGGRVSLRQKGASAVYEAADSSHLQLTEEADSSLTLVVPGGTRMTYRVHGAVYQCETIKDRHGNFISVAYHPAGNVREVTDTLGRVIGFGYYADGRLEKITQTWRREVETPSGAQTVTETHQWAKFDYDNKAIDINFGGLTPSGAQTGQTFRALTKVSLPDGSDYTFDYTTWGQVNKIANHAQDGRLLNQVSFDLPADASEPRDDCPRFENRRFWAAYWNGDANGVPDQSGEDAVTLYDEYNFAGGLGKAKAPDGTLRTETYETSGWKKGLVTRADEYSADDHQNPKKWTLLEWTQDDVNLPYRQNPRVEGTHVHDGEGNHRRTKVTYTAFGLPADVEEFDQSATTVIRRTHTDYVTGSVGAGGTYVGKRIIGLPSERTVYGTEGGQERLYSKVSYDYDLPGEFLVGAGQVTQHDDLYGDAFAVRGNLCRVRRWDVGSQNGVSNANNIAKSVTSETGHDTNGSVVFTRDAVGHRVSVSYADSDGGARLAYPTSVTDPDGFTSSIWYNYDMGVVTRSETPKPNATDGQPQVTRLYDAAGRLLKVKSAPGGAYALWEYGANGLYVKKSTTVDVGRPETFVMSVADGAGRVIGSLRSLPGGYSARRSAYDRLGRLVSQSNPAEVSVGGSDPWNVALWQPAGEDATSAGGTGWVYTTREYDWKGRPTRITNPGSPATTEEFLYGGCGCAGGEVVTTRDEAGRRRRVTYDWLGRVWKMQALTQQPDKPQPFTADGSEPAYSTVTTTYDALDRPTQVSERAESNGVERVTTLSYDGHGRLRSRHTPGQDAGASTSYTYYPDDEVQTVTDGRGVKSTFGYNGRHLPTTVGFNLLGLREGQSAEETGDVAFGYDAAGNRTHMSDGAGATTYHYDALSRLDWEERQFAGLAGAFRLGYEYNLAGEVKRVTDRFGAAVEYGYDDAGRVEKVGADGDAVKYASGIKYRAWGAPSSITYGNNALVTAGYDGRMRLKSYQVESRPAQFAHSTAMRSEYGYYADGRVRFADDGVDDRFDRAYDYDLAGRLREAYSGAQARDFAATGAANPLSGGPYRVSYQYDEFDGLRRRESRYWGGRQTSTPTLEAGTGRNQAWGYDADGRLTGDTAVAYTYDAAGQTRRVRALDGSKAFLVWADGDGRVSRREEETPVGGAAQKTYYLRSTVLGGAVAEELNAGGGRVKTYVHLGGRALAERAGNLVTWLHTNPVTGGLGRSYADGTYETTAEPDAEGINLGVEDPAGGGGGPYSPEPWMPSVGNATGPGAPQCTMDGMLLPDCELVRNLLASGAARQCPDNDCGVRRRDGGWQVVRLTENGFFENIGRRRPTLKQMTPEERARAHRIVSLWGQNPFGDATDEGSDFDPSGLGFGGGQARPQDTQDHTFPGRGNPEKEREPTCGPFVVPNASSLVGLKCVGNGDCVPLVQTPIEIMGQSHPGLPHTSNWREGVRVRGNSSIERGTVIATFKDGRYPPDVPLGHKHAAIYDGQTQEGIWVIDQYRPLTAIQRRLIKFDEARTPSNNGNRFSVVMTDCTPRK